MRPCDGRQHRANDDNRYFVRWPGAESKVVLRTECTTADAVLTSISYRHSEHMLRLVFKIRRSTSIN